MSFAPTQEKSETQEKNIAFYNEIATNYNSILDNESTNEIVRKTVKEKFISIVKPGWVLDFGGGTGLDLDWLIRNQYSVIFCEPSEGMREKAIGQYKTQDTADRIIFIENDQVNFTNWHLKLPFSTKIDAILSDFAVINCIADIELLFNNLAMIVKPGGHLIALMLKHDYKKAWHWKIRNLIKSLFSDKPTVINITYSGHKQIVYMHSPKGIKKASKTNFDLCIQETLFEFTLFHFIRK